MFRNILVEQNYLLWLTSFCLPYRKHSSDIPGMVSSSILLGVKVSQEMLSTTILLHDADGTSVLLCIWDSCSCWSLELWDGKKSSIPYIWEVILTYVPITLQELTNNPLHKELETHTLIFGDTPNAAGVDKVQ